MYKTKQLFTIALLTFGFVQGCSKVFAVSVDEPHVAQPALDADDVEEFTAECKQEEIETHDETGRTDSARYIMECVKDSLEYDALEGGK